MRRIPSHKELEALQKELQDKHDPDRTRILVCHTGCKAMGADQLLAAFKEGVASAGLQEEVEVVETGCHGCCAGAPVIAIEPQGIVYHSVQPENVAEVIEKTIKNGECVDSLAAESVDDKPVFKREEIPFYRQQQKIVLRNCGRIDPTNWEHYLARDGYSALAKALAGLTPKQVIDEVLQSGLRGRGGAGFPTGRKWQFARNAKGSPKYIICNADEGDPGAFMDRSILEGDPHSVIEGMIIGAFAIGAQKGFIYVRAEYPIAVRHAHKALDQARALGMLGENILGSSFDFEIEVREGAGAFVCGEETALIGSIEGKRGKGKFHALKYTESAELPDKDYPMLLTTGRLLYHFHTGTMTRRVESLEAISPEPFVEVNAEDAKKLGIADGELIQLRSRRGQTQAKALIGSMVDRGILFMPFHFKEAAVNLLTNDALDPVAKIPEFKVCAVAIEKVS